MKRNEKILLLDLILRDIRGNWAFQLSERVEESFKLAKEVELDDFVNIINGYDYGDGRYFRDYYEELELIHKLPNKIKGRSDEFMARSSVLTYPEYAFSDYEESKDRIIR